MKVKYHQSNQSVTKIQAWICRVFRENDNVQVKAQRVEQTEKHQLNYTDKNYIKNLKSKYFGLNKKS